MDGFLPLTSCDGGLDGFEGAAERNTIYKKENLNPLVNLIESVISEVRAACCHL